MRQKKVDNTIRQDKIKDTTCQTKDKGITRQMQTRIKDELTFLAKDKIQKEIQRIILFNKRHKQIIWTIAGNRKLCHIRIIVYN